MLTIRLRVPQVFLHYARLLVAPACSRRMIRIRFLWFHCRFISSRAADLQGEQGCKQASRAGSKGFSPERVAVPLLLLLTFRYFSFLWPLDWVLWKNRYIGERNVQKVFLEILVSKKAPNQSRLMKRTGPSETWLHPVSPSQKKHLRDHTQEIILICQGLYVLTCARSCVRAIAINTH